MEGVIALHRQNSKRLGFFPSGAFEEKRELRQDFCSLGSGRFTWLPALPPDSADQMIFWLAATIVLP